MDLQMDPVGEGYFELYPFFGEFFLVVLLPCLSSLTACKAGGKFKEHVCIDSYALLKPLHAFLGLTNGPGWRRIF